ncbi:MAG TPA: xylulokinase [Methylomirabilota bacterium]|nr:xylulokinase [Methylomirabilota bacterium]
MYLGIDLGTSELKVVLIDHEQRLRATARQALALQRPHPQWSEQDPAAWWQAVEAALADLRGRAPRELAAVEGIGLSGQMHGAVLLDAAGRVLRPAILWNDVRSSRECAELEARAPALRQITGNLAMPGFTAPKLLWVARHEPEIFRATAKVLLPKDYLRRRLTGEDVSEMSDASGTLWLDVGRRDWSDALLEATGLTRAHMPRLVEGRAAGGTLRTDLARAWGMGDGVVVSGGGGDNAATAIGIGAVADGQAFLSLGTSGVLFVATAAFRPNPAEAVHTFCHALPGHWNQMAVMLSAASCLRWVTQLTGAKDEAALLAEVEALSEDRRRQAPLFLPYLSGERTPHNDASAKGVWFGMTHDTDRAALGYAVLEGVAFGMADGYRALRAVGTSLRNTSLVGGGARSRFWAELLASALDLPLQRHAGGEVGAAFGAARLAILATDASADVAAVCQPPPLLDSIAPVPAWSAMLAPRFERFRELYRMLRPLFAAA